LAFYNHKTFQEKITIIHQASMKSVFRSIEKIFSPPIVPEGDGATVRRIIGTSLLKRLDPFLMLDHFNVKLPAGFPDHPHRGFETVTYMLKGSMYHEDFKGHKGLINPGDCQWMTAGKGIVHAEMPGSKNEVSNGFQLWINLPNKERLCDPQYQEIPKDKIPVVQKDNTTVKVISGESLGTKGPIFHRTPTFYLDVEMEAKGKLEQLIPKNWNGFVYLYEGSAFFGSEELKASDGQVVLLKKEEPETLLVQTKDDKAKFIFIAGQPLNESVVQYGPFVAGTMNEIYQTFEDYEEGKNGFEGAKEFVSKISSMSQL